MSGELFVLFAFKISPSLVSFQTRGGRFDNETPDKCQARTSHFVPGVSCQMRLQVVVRDLW
jgi:hypothetical protein